MSGAGTTAAETGENAVDVAAQLALDAVDSSLGAEAAEAARLKLQLSTEEWMDWESRKDVMMEERMKIREQLKQKFEEFCERSFGAGIARGIKGSISRFAAAY